MQTASTLLHHPQGSLTVHNGSCSPSHSIPIPCRGTEAEKESMTALSKDISWKWHTPLLQVCPAKNQRIPHGIQGGSIQSLPRPVKYELQHQCRQSFWLNSSTSWNPAVCPEVITLSELSQSQRDKYCTLPHIRDTKHSQTHRSRKNDPRQWLGRGNRICDLMGVEFWLYKMSEF